MSIISIKKVSKNYGTKKVLDDVSFNIEKGEIYGLLGSNGAGKSTLTKIILGFEKATEGKVSFYSGTVIDNKSKVAVVPQNIAAYLDFTVKQNMEFFAALTNLTKKEQKERIEYLIKWLEIESFTNTRVKFLSGGYQRLVNMALSIIDNPKIIFLDEPTVGLDPKMRFLFWSKLIELKKEGKTIILTTHYMDEAEHLCDKIALLKNGKLITTGSSSELIEKYGGQNVMIFNLNKELDEKTLQWLTEIEKLSIKHNKKQLTISFEQKNSFNQIIKALNKYLVTKDYKIISTYLKEPTLEEVFLSLTGDKMSG